MTGYARGLVTGATIVTLAAMLAWISYAPIFEQIRSADFGNVTCDGCGLFPARVVFAVVGVFAIVFVFLHTLTLDQGGV